MSGGRKFDARDHAGRIVVAAPLAAVGLMIGAEVPLNWYDARHQWAAVPDSLYLAAVVLPAGVAVLGAGAGGLLIRRATPVRVAAAVGAAAFGLAAYVALSFAFAGTMRLLGV